MAYQAKRRKQFAEDFELVTADGVVAHTLHVALDADDMVAKISRKYAELTKTLAETTEIQRRADSGEIEEGCVEKLGMAVVNLFEAVFGQEDTQTIVDFYDSRYIEMCREVTPFITQVVMPRCIEIKKENQKSILQTYNRKQRRSMLARMK
ncbi:hypothetical protein NE454_26585 [Blautia producta]|uniref:hypothetical protein n=1 Tax=Blautia producta TaxID=33035 RepID=UPI002109E66C|nr:hypothetical protein [Blautia producta]MCQ5127960.1 hypothetical protein [Blautia producta]